MSRVQLRGALRAHAHAPVAPSGSGNDFADIWGSDALHHYRADLGITVVTGVSSWADQIGSADFTQASTSLQPTLNEPGSVNSQDSVTFNGSTHRLELSGNFGDINSNSLYIFMVYKRAAGTPNEYTGPMGHTSAGYGPQFSWHSASSTYDWRALLPTSSTGFQLVTTTVDSDADPHLHEVWRDSTNMVYEVDAGAIASQSATKTAPSAEPSNDLFLGRAFNTPGLEVELFELGVATNWEATKQADIIAYVNTRYGWSL